MAANVLLGEDRAAAMSVLLGEGWLWDVLAGEERVVAVVPWAPGSSS